MNEQGMASKNQNDIAPFISGLAENSSAVELPLYKCFKNVRAAKITDIHISQETPSAILFFGDILGRREVTEDWFNKHNPAAGGYFVRYADGYESYSPSHAFENGYSLKLKNIDNLDYDTLGTVEPIKVKDDNRSVEIASFLLGFVEKYKNANLHPIDIMNYLRGLFENYSTSIVAPGKNPKSSPTEEIKYLGRMLTATTIEDKERLEAIIKDLTRLSASAQV